ncbi:MAG: translation initiation factor IF-3 [Alphaproteobacteria bacterium]|nr:translation initiation factor IF-3 [Alphaproteobacteria bacterium]
MANFNRSSPRDVGPRTNGQIRAEKVRVIDEDGEMVGVMSVRDAIEKAEDAGLDLIEISPNAEPPVCKIGDFGKYRYEQQKKEAAARKNQKIVTTKEVKLRPNIEEHDIQVKLRNARRFFDDGDKVRFTLQFRGRENEHREFGYALIRRIKEELLDVGKVEMDARQEGNSIVMIMVPAKAP